MPRHFLVVVYHHLSIIIHLKLAYGNLFGKLTF